MDFWGGVGVAWGLQGSEFGYFWGSERMQQVFRGGNNY